MASMELIKKKDIYISEMTSTLGSHIQTLDNMGKEMTKIQDSYDALINENANLKKDHEIVASKYEQAIN